MAFDTTSLDILSLAMGMIGENGGIVVDIKMADHNDILEDELTKREFGKLVKSGQIVVGRKGTPITVDDVRKFTKKLKKETSREIFDNGRTYFFEGVEKSRNGWEFCWGS